MIYVAKVITNLVTVHLSYELHNLILFSNLVSTQNLYIFRSCMTRKLIQTTRNMENKF